MSNLLLLEDDISLIDGLNYSLKKNGFYVDIARTIEEAEKRLKEIERYDLLILDVTLPDGTGFDFCENVRKQNKQIPIIFLTASDEEVNIIRGLDCGGDDYVTKPFTPMELMARVNSQLRRYNRFQEALNKKEEKERSYMIGGLEVNEDRVEVLVDGRQVKMTPIEFKILLLLIKHPGRVFSAEEIYERVWNEKAVNTETIMVHIRNIREKIEINPKEPKYVKVVWGIGYKMEKQM